MRAIITVIGNDKTGIIYKVSKLMFENQVNIEDISQTLMQEYFTMLMLVDFSSSNAEFKEIKQQLTKLGDDENLSIKIQHEELFNSMHQL